MIKVSVIGNGRELSVEAATRELSKNMREIKSKLPSITAQAVNALATWARRETITQTALSLKVKESMISGYFIRDKDGNKRRVPRFKLTRASPRIPVAKLRVGKKSIEFSDVPSSESRGPGGGVTAAGQFRAGAFKARINKKKRVLERKGKSRLPLRSPVILTPRALQKSFEDHVAGPRGRAVYEAKFEELTDRALEKAGFS